MTETSVQPNMNDVVIELERLLRTSDGRHPQDVDELKGLVDRAYKTVTVGNQAVKRLDEIERAASMEAIVSGWLGYEVRPINIQLKDLTGPIQRSFFRHVMQNAIHRGGADRLVCVLSKAAWQDLGLWGADEMGDQTAEDRLNGHLTIRIGDMIYVRPDDAHLHLDEFNLSEERLVATTVLFVPQEGFYSDHPDDERAQKFGGIMQRITYPF